MSVLIKGMDKETAVRICAYAGVRMDDSDFIPVPPHGRLIDADALLDDLLFPSKQFEQGMRELIGDAPTVIPAEEEE